MADCRKGSWNIGRGVVGILAALMLLAGCGGREIPPSGAGNAGGQQGEAAQFPQTEESGAQPGTSGAESARSEAAAQPGAAGAEGARSEAAAQPGAAGAEGARSEAAAQPGAADAEGAQPETGQAGGAQSNAESGGAQPQITLVMVGDILLHDRVALSGRLEAGGYDFGAVFGETKEMIAEADLALVNQEVILGGEELGITGYPAFNGPYELGDELVDSGFDVVLHATNHALDKRGRGLRSCLSFWQEQHPETAVLGIHDSSEDQQEIYVYEQEGIRIAILNYTYGTNGIPLPEDMPFGVDLLERERVISDLKRAGEMADFVVVCPHWGKEYTLQSTGEQEKWAELFAENGADLVLGTHPHVIEPIEWVGGALVYYSLGNYVNWTSGTGAGVANRMVGGMARVTIGLDENGEAEILSYGVEPLVCHVEQGFGGVRVYPLEEYTQELAARNEIISQDGNFSLEYCQELVQEVFGELAEQDVSTDVERK